MNTTPPTDKLVKLTRALVFLTTVLLVATFVLAWVAYSTNARLSAIQQQSQTTTEAPLPGAPKPVALAHAEEEHEEDALAPTLPTTPHRRAVQSDSNLIPLAFDTNTVAPVAASDAVRVSVPTNLPTAAALAVSAKTNGGTNFVRQIREQMLAGSPEAASKYDAMINGLMNGKLNLNDLRREAKASADQLRDLKRELGADAGDALDGYLEVLNNFLKETVAEPTNAANARIPR